MWIMLAKTLRAADADRAPVPKGAAISVTPTAQKKKKK